MNWLEDVAEYVTPNALVAAGVLFLAPMLLPIVGSGLRPVAKGAVRGYLTLQDKVKELAAAGTEQVSDLVAEAKAEHAAAGGAAAIGDASSGSTSSKERKSQSSAGGKEKTA